VGILCSFSLEEVQAIIDSGNPVFRELAIRRASHGPLSHVLEARRSGGGPPRPFIGYVQVRR
jgi:hypothetical protein